MKKMGDKLCAAVQGDMAWNTMLGEDMENEELCELWRHDGIMSQHHDPFPELSPKSLDLPFLLQVHASSFPLHPTGPADQSDCS